MRSRFVKNQNGMTITEVLLASVLLVGVAAVGFQVILSAQQTQSAVSERVGEEMDLSSGLLELRGELNNSFIMRSGQLDCGNIGSLIRTNRTVENYELVNNSNQNFSFYYSTFSAIASRDVQHSNSVFVTDAYRFNEGQLVLLMSSSNSSIAGFFRIKSKEVQGQQASGRLVLETIDMAGNPTACKPSSQGANLEELFSKASVFLIHETSIVTYRFKPSIDQVYDDSNRPIVAYDLFKSYWPSGGSHASNPARLAIPRVISLKMNPSWVDFSATSQLYNSRSGRWTAAVGLRSYRKTIYGNDANKVVYAPYQAGIRAVYELPSSRPLNPVAMAGAPTVKVQFPTCGTFLQRTNMFRSPSSEATSVFLVESFVSEKEILGAIQIEVKSSDSRPVKCYQDPGDNGN